MGVNPDSDIQTLCDLELSTWFPRFSTVTQMTPREPPCCESLRKINEIMAKCDIEHVQQCSGFRGFHIGGNNRSDAND